MKHYFVACVALVFAMNLSASVPKQISSQQQGELQQNSNTLRLQSSDLDQCAILGNWYDPSKNEWSYGFFEDFVIYDGEFWRYQKLTFKKKNGTVTLQNGEKSLQLKLKMKDDSTLQIASGKHKAVRYKMAGRTLPHYKTADTTRFADNQFARIDTAYITGYVRNRKSTNPFDISLNDMITDEQVTYYGALDSIGRFQVKVPLYNSSMAFLDWNMEGMKQITVLEANEHCFLFYDEQTKQTLFMGENSRLHTELATFDYSGVWPENQMGLKALVFLAAKQQQYQKANEYTHSILKQMPNPSERMRYFLTNFYRYEFASSLMQFRFQLNRNNKEQLPDEFIKYVRDTFLAEPLVPITLCRGYFSFMRDYVGYHNDQKGNSSINSIEVLKPLLKNGKLKLDKADSNLVELVTDYYMAMWNRVDSVELKKMASKITTKELERYAEIMKQNSELMEEEVARMFAEMSLERNYEGINAVTSDQTVRDYYLGTSLYKTLDNERKPIDEELFNEMISRIETPLFKDKIVALQKQYAELSSKTLEHTESLKNTDHLKEVADADSLWKALISPYKGKIIYVDFWGTWCGPCKAEMEYVAGIKKQFAGKDVVFIYFANNSPEESWKNVIKSYSLTGESSVHYRLPSQQQDMIERRFNIRSFPTYLLIDREGNVVDTKPPRPSQKQKMVDYLNDWLSK
ncbi:MAG: TlpA disulfide reductase family protein [Bacteroidales bacterium]|nr:TlpA disulfide reductase family protein [Bacteroidales bacterium]